MLNKRAQFSGLAWFFTIILVTLVLSIFFIFSLGAGKAKQIKISNEVTTDHFFQRLDSFWGLNSFLFSQDNITSNKIIYSLEKLKGVNLVSPQFLSSNDVSENKNFLISAFANYSLYYITNNYFCYMLIVDHAFVGKSCTDGFKMNNFNFFGDQKVINSSFIAERNGQEFGVKIISSEVKNE
jgi:hypothetical protein